MRFFPLAAVLLIMVSNAVQSEIPRPEHPRPDFQRDHWINLNGVWEFAETDDPDASFLKGEMPDRITVPFCRESELSGLGRKGFVDYVWYRRTIEIPESWEGLHTLLHIGACDWETTVWVNGRRVGFHRGGNSQFSFDLTDFLSDGENTLVIRAYDDVRSGLQTAGKQSQREESHGIFYTRTTGIWQTVWLEAVNPVSIENFSVVPDIGKGAFDIDFDLRGDFAGAVLIAEAFLGDRSVGRAEAPARWRTTTIHLPLSEKKLWSVDSPTLYTLRLRVVREKSTLDEVASYGGLREITLRGRAILLNGEPVFQRLVLDQGFYPDGIWTAPSEGALIQDIKLSQSVGFNGARLHQKVFEPRFLYHADRLGYLLWGEYPSFGVDYSNTATDEPILREWHEILLRDRNHPSIVGWCPFNETPPEAGRIQKLVVDLTQRLEPTRPVIETSGWTHTHLNPELLDAHDYNQNPETFKEKWDRFFQINNPFPEKLKMPSGADLRIPYFVSEFGGIGWDVGGGWGYGDTPKTMDEFYARFEGLVEALLENPNFFGYCYTQLTDVEQERNGVFTFDRKEKFDAGKLHAIQTQTAAYEKNPVFEVPEEKPMEWSTLIKTAHDKGPDTEWRYVTDDPGAGWEKAGFDDSSWSTGQPGFGARGRDLSSTPWNTPDIWLRKEFELTEEQAGDFTRAVIVVFFDNATELFVNGESVWKRGGWNNTYEIFDVTDALKGNLKAGKNTLAVHTHQDEGGQYIDLGLLLGR